MRSARVIKARVAADFGRHRGASVPSARNLLHLFLTNPGFVATVLYRLQQDSYSKGRRFRPALLRSLTHAVTGADFLPGAEIGPGLLIHHPAGIVVGGGARIGSNATILQQVTIGERYADGAGPPAYPTIGNGCTIGAGAKILGEISVGDGVSVGANSVVFIDLPSGAVAVGAPARVIAKTSSMPSGNLERDRNSPQ